MAEQFLDRSDVVGVVEQMRGKRVPQRVRCGVLRDTGAAQRIAQCALNRLRIGVMPPGKPAAWIGRKRSEGNTYCQAQSCAGFECLRCNA
jgi:hypothetical protein